MPLVNIAPKLPPEKYQQNFADAEFESSARTRD
jgi:hypothetical protein